jgi:hypothetical protein
VEDGLGPPLDDILYGNDHSVLLDGRGEPNVQQQRQKLLLPVQLNRFNGEFKFPAIFSGRTFPPFLLAGYSRHFKISRHIY